MKQQTIWVLAVASAGPYANYLQLALDITTNFMVKFAKLADHTFIRHDGVPKWIAGWQFLFQKVKWQ